MLRLITKNRIISTITTSATALDPFFFLLVRRRGTGSSWSTEHSDESNRDTVVSFIAALGNGFKCLHSHCVQRHWREFRDELEKRNPGLAPYYGNAALPIIAHATLAETFLRDNHDQRHST